MTDSGSQGAGWLINNMGPYRINSIRGGSLAGHTATLDSNNLIVENIMMNDDRNGSDYRCVIVPSAGTPSLANIIEESDPTILYVAGEKECLHVHVLTDILSYIYVSMYVRSIGEINGGKLYVTFHGKTGLVRTW